MISRIGLLLFDSAAKVKVHRRGVKKSVAVDGCTGIGQDMRVRCVKRVLLQAQAALTRAPSCFALRSLHFDSRTHVQGDVCLITIGFRRHRPG